jgi:peptidoglycan/LPS O-acetylase OafA/YrhL
MLKQILSYSSPLDPPDARHLKYRPDIDGLRALAVLVVVAFHYAPGDLPSGFIGVDIFFVISGYLITGMLVKTFCNHTFSLLDFYQRRIRRIFPALFLVLLLCLLVGWFLLFPNEYARLSKHVAAGAGFVQNFALWAEAGYFDTQAIQKPLLHLWSLAVEEQFYILWPLTLWLFIRARSSLLKVIAAIALLSFAINLWHVYHDTTAAFYFPLGRGWELMLGAWLAVAEREGIQLVKRAHHLQSWLGMILIVTGLMFINPNLGFPGFWALLPVVGAVLMISAGPTAFLNRRLLSLRPVVWIGLISYPLYLWHWALWSLASVVFGELEYGQSRKVRLVCFIVSLLLAWLTYRYLEQPLRRRSKAETTTALATGVAVLGLAGLGIGLSNGIHHRPGHVYNTQAASLVASVKRSPLREQCYGLNEGSSFPDGWKCVLGAAEAKKWVMAYGDSHSLSMIPALNTYGKKHHIKVVYAGIYGCAPLFDVIRIRHDHNQLHAQACYMLGQKAAELAKQNKASAIVVINAWSGDIPRQTIRPDELSYLVSKKPVNDKTLKGKAAFVHGLKLTLDYYQKLGVPVLLAGNNPQQVEDILPIAPLRFARTSDTRSLAEKINATSATLKEHVRDQAVVNRVLTNIASQYDNVTVMNSDSVLCNKHICPWVRDDKFLYYDDDHLSIAGAMAVYPLLEKRLNQMLKGHPPDH